MPTARDKLHMKPVHRVAGRGPLDPRSRPAGTRTYVPGYLSDQEQHEQDCKNLGIAPLAILAAAKPITSLFHISFGKAVDSEKGIAQQLQTMASAGNLTAFTAILSRGQIQTQGYAQLYNPIISSLRSAHPDWYQTAYAMLQPGKQPGGKAFWSYAQGDVLSAVQNNSIYAPSAPLKQGLAPPYSVAPSPPSSLPIPTSQLPGGSTDLPGGTPQPVTSTTTVVYKTMPDGTVVPVAQPSVAQAGLASMFGGSNIPLLMGVGLLAFLMNKRR